MRPEQVGWLLRRARLGGRCFVAVRQLGTKGRDVLWIFHGQDAGRLKAGGLRAATPLITCEGGPDQWDWAAVRRVLEGG